MRYPYNRVCEFFARKNFQRIVHENTWSMAPTTKCLRMRAVNSAINRYYDPTTYQFLSVDPQVATTGQPYAFVNDNPMNATDPLGNKWYEPWTWTWKTWATIGAVTLTVAAAGTGVGAAFELVVAGGEATSTVTTLTYASLATGLGSSAIDFANCINGDKSSCAGAALGVASLIPGVAAAAGGESALAQGLAAASASVAVAGATYDTTTACIVPTLSGSPSKSAKSVFTKARVVKRHQAKKRR